MRQSVEFTNGTRVRCHAWHSESKLLESCLEQRVCNGDSEWLSLWKLPTNWLVLSHRDNAVYECWNNPVFYFSEWKKDDQPHSACQSWIPSRGHSQVVHWRHEDQSGNLSTHQHLSPLNWWDCLPIHLPTELWHSTGDGCWRHPLGSIFGSIPLGQLSQGRTLLHLVQMARTVVRM